MTFYRIIQTSVLLLIISVLTLSCDDTPEAFFLVYKDVVITGEEVKFYSDTPGTSAYEWDFGDGNTSDEVNPVHVYSEVGTYEVTLTIYNPKGNSSSVSKTITVNEPSTLTIQVKELDDKYVVPGATVTLYYTTHDWDQEKDHVVVGITDETGSVDFNFLGAYVYYVDVVEENHNNRALGLHDISYIRTQQISPDIHTLFTAYVEHSPEGDSEK